MARLMSVLALLFVVVVYVSAESERADKVPKEIREAEKTLIQWLNNLDGQTTEQVRGSLGPPTKETNWLFKEKKEPLFKYKIGESSELSLYFHKGRVVKSSLLMLQ